MPGKTKLTFHPLTPARWNDAVALFGPRGACAGCWCMAWRLPYAQYQKQAGAGNRRTLRRLVKAGSSPGVLAYVDGRPAGWCSIAPREEFAFLSRSRVLRPVDEASVWSVSCFFVGRQYRRQGVTVPLIKAAVHLARKKGARIVEGYPVDPQHGKLPGAFLWTGIPKTFLRAGFKEVARRSATRPVMRKRIV
ncbi:MAG: GNAT family N-acetyltransferase [Acidobacteria bacterium]|nr:GNAT family N-acetyltransferase [Acidobacteriota bacterium]